MKFKRKKITTWVTALVILGAAAGAYWGWYVPRQRAADAAAKKKLATDGGDKDRTYKVRRDDLVIGLMQGGYINANKKHKLALQANYRTQLLWVIDPKIFPCSHILY